MRIQKRTTLQELALFSNQLTLARIALTPFFVWWFLSDAWYFNWLSLLVFAIAAITDWWDGHHARKHKTVSDFGRFLDPFADKFLTISAMVTFCIPGFVPWWMVGVIFVRDFALTWMRARAEKQGKKFETLYFAKVKTAFQLVAIVTIISLWCIQAALYRFDLWTDKLPAQPETIGYLTIVFTVLIGATMVLALASWLQYVLRPSNPQETETDD